MKMKTKKTDSCWVLWWQYGLSVDSMDHEKHSHGPSKIGALLRRDGYWRYPFWHPSLLSLELTNPYYYLFLFLIGKYQYLVLYPMH